MEDKTMVAGKKRQREEELSHNISTGSESAERTDQRQRLDGEAADSVQATDGLQMGSTRKKKKKRAKGVEASLLTSG